MLDPRVVLGLPLDEPVDDVRLRKEFRAALLNSHPDKPGGCRERFEAVKGAYDTFRAADVASPSASTLGELIAGALRSKSAYFKANVGTMSARAVRRLLEETLGMRELELDANKALVNELIDEIILTGQSYPAEEETPRAHVLKAMCNRATVHVPPSVYTKNRGCQEGVARALEALLAKHGLTALSSPGEIRKVKRRLATERELDGMDAANIIHGEGERLRTPKRRAATDN